MRSLWAVVTCARPTLLLSCIGMHLKHDKCNRTVIGRFQNEEALASSVETPFVENSEFPSWSCRQKKVVDHAEYEHMHNDKNGLDADEGLRRYLSSVLVEPGKRAGNQQNFSMLWQHNASSSWSSNIVGCIEHGKFEHALDLFEMMQEHCVYASRHILLTLLKACAKLKCLESSQKIHTEIVKEGFEGDPFVASALMNAYAKCGSLVEAQDMFDKLQGQDVVLWTVLVAGYANHGLGEKAFDCLKRMRSEGVSPNAVTFVCALKGCTSIGAIGRGREIHAEIAQEEFEKDPRVATALVDMYAKVGLLVEAQELFHELSVRNVVSWTALVAGYVVNGFGKEALICFEQMLSKGAFPNAVTYVCILKACGSIGATCRGLEMHIEVAKGGLERDLQVSSALVDMYSKFGLLAEAREVFDELPVRDVIMWTALIAGYVGHGFGEEAWRCLEQMQLEGVSPNAVTLICILKGCGSLGVIGQGQDLHDKIAKEGFERDSFLGNTLVDMYAKCGALEEARDVFDDLQVRDVVSWNALIGGYMEQGFSMEALKSLEEMHVEGVFVDDVTLVCSLKACGNIGAIERGQLIHAEIAKEGFERYPLIGNTLVDLYAKCGLLAEAHEVFDELPDRDAISWTVLIAGYACRGESELVFVLFEKMRETGIQPDSVTLLSVLTVCSHAGLVDESLKYFEAFSKEYFTPTIEHHNCMVDLLGRSGHFDKAMAISEEMPFQPNLVMWITMLGACQRSGNTELGKHAFESAMGLNEDQGTAFVLMSNIHADVHMCV